MLGTDDARQWRLYLRGNPFEHALFGAVGSGGARIVPVFDHRPGSRPIAWEQLRLPALLRRDEVDFVFSPGYSLPPRTGLPSMVTLHDLSFEHLREEFSWREGWRRRWLARRAARQARRVLVDTETMARDLIETYDLSPSRVGIVPLAVDRRFFEPTSADSPDASAVEAFSELDLPSEYLLFLGTALPRRRLDLVIRAFASVASAHPDLHLVLAGADRLPDPTSLDTWISQCGIGPRIRRLPYVPEAALAQLYARARATLYLSTYEGYGLPPLESLAAGTPAIVTPGMALDDLLPDYPYRTEADGESLAIMLRRVLEIPKEANRAPWLASVHAKLRSLSWTRCSELFLEQVELASDPSLASDSVHKRQPDDPKGRR